MRRTGLLLSTTVTHTHGRLRGATTGRLPDRQPTLSCAPDRLNGGNSIALAGHFQVGSCLHASRIQGSAFQIREQSRQIYSETY